jgi:hypothetical protein
MSKGSGKFVTYLNFAARQADSGLILDMQRKSILDYLDGGRRELVAEFGEIESGKYCDRPELSGRSRPAKSTRRHWSSRSSTIYPETPLLLRR